MMQAYAEYKDSGVDWLGKVPAGWEEKPVFAVTALKSVTHCADRELLSVYLDRGVIRFSDIDAKRTNVTSLDLSHYQAVDRRDFVLNNQQAWRGSVGVSSHIGIVSPAYIVLKLSDAFHEGFANYLFRDGDMVAHYLICSKGVGTIQRNLYWPKLKRTPLFLPPLPEQTAIADFLDDKTAKIEALVGIKRRQIELLAERKQILIQNAVTKGLNPDAPMKNSSVDWIGDIPAHWEVKRLASMGRFSKGGGFSKADLTEKGVSAILYGDIYTQYEFVIDRAVRCISPTVAEGSTKLALNDLLFTGSGETKEDIGKCVVFRDQENTVAGGDVIIFRQSECDPLFLSYSLNTDGVIEEKAKSSKGEIIVHTYGSKLREIFVPIPPKAEQENIAEFIWDGCEKINDAITIKQNQIKKLNEYKTILINAAVTGKIKVA